MRPAAAYVAGRADGGGLMPAAAAAVYAIGSVICHQQPERSFHLWAVALPVCARCIGIYAGGALVSLYIASGLGLTGFSRTSFSTTTARRALLLALIPAVASLLYEWTTGHTPSNTVRAATGIVLGGGVASVVLLAIVAEARSPRTDAVN